MGAAVAVLNLHGRDDAAMAPLITGVWQIYDPNREMPAHADQMRRLDEGAHELLVGFRKATVVRATIQQALHIIMGWQLCTARDAYLYLASHAVNTGVSLPALAKMVLRESDTVPDS